MYMTRTLAQLRKFPELVSLHPEGPNSGYLVIQDEESETYFCFGLYKHETLRELPFPQNKELTVNYSNGSCEPVDFYGHPLFLIPVPNLPLSCNRYYAIVPHGQRTLLAYTCSKEKNMGKLCFFRYIRDVGARPLDPQNIYQQFEIVPNELLCRSPCAYFKVNSVASDGFPPCFFRQEEWVMLTKIVHHFTLGSAQGLDCELRARLPHLSLSESGRVVIGKWYCPFIFVKEAGRLRDQVERSMYYEMNLEQRWEPIFSCPNNGGNSVAATDVLFEKEEVFVNGNKGVMNERNAIDGVVWFTSSSNLREGGMSFGLRVEILERMKWEQERGGWIGGEEEKIKIMEEQKECGKWRSLICYVLVERFKLKRMDGSLAMEYDFKHFHQIKTVWE
ncbi:uncharacterized protein [Henckelia pumila]|uniref:uncharacterized protein n=1 Tax=Henckelia pumila TaxID=405737 RepID=UPI003C6DDC6C